MNQSDKKAFLVISEDASGMPIALRLQKEGYETYYSIKASEKNDSARLAERQGFGLIQKKLGLDATVKKLVSQKTKLIDRLVIVFDMNHNWELADMLKGLGYMVVGSGRYLSEIEFNRKYGISEMIRMGIDTPERYEFRKVDKGVRFIKSQPKKKRWILIADNEMGFYSDSNDELITYMEEYKSRIETPFVLCEKIKGIETSIWGWFNGKRFAFFTVSLKRKRSAVNDLGRDVGCAGSVDFVASADSRIIKDSLAKVEQTLILHGIPCSICLDAIITKNKVYGLGWSVGLNNYSVLGMFASVGDVLEELAIGVSNENKPEKKFGTSLRISRDVIKGGIPIRTDNENVWFNDVQKKDDKLETVGNSGFVMTVSGIGDSITEAVKSIFGKSKIFVSGINYRTDIGVKANDDYNNLLSLGWI